jgi:hypothetical protein
MPSMHAPHSGRNCTIPARGSVNIAPCVCLPVDKVSWNVCASVSVPNDCSRCRELTEYRTVHLCAQSPTCAGSQVCYKVPAAHSLLLSAAGMRGGNRALLFPATPTAAQGRPRSLPRTGRARAGGVQRRGTVAVGEVHV